jgi:nucleoid-associated protein YgaU
MGLYSFVSDIGDRLFGDDEDPAEAIEKHINEDNPGVDGLKIDVEDGVATVTGKAKDQSAFEKVILMAGNVLGINSVEAAELDLETGETPTEEEVVFYTIKKGDTLWAIAADQLGNGARYPEIFEANKEVIKDPDLIYPGQQIRIPG